MRAEENEKSREELLDKGKNLATARSMGSERKHVLIKTRISSPPRWKYSICSPTIDVRRAPAVGVPRSLVWFAWVVFLEFLVCREHTQTV